MPTPLAFHGIGIRADDPEAFARRCRALLGWRTLSKSARQIVLGEGPELFLTIRKTRPGEAEGVEALHLAVRHIARARRATIPDPLGGDSWTRSLTESLAVTVRELARAPEKRWRAKRRKPER